MPAVDIRVFEKEIGELLKRQVGILEDQIVEEVARVYNNIMANSPTISFYYQANHRIGVFSAGFGGTQLFKSGGAPLNPAQKPPDAPPGEYESLAADALTRELPKLEKFELGDILRISNVVPYADDVETIHGVYEAAEADLGLDL